MKRSFKKILAVITILVLVICCFSGCGSNEAAEPSDTESNGGLKIVTTIFPEYDWVMNILGDNPAGAEVTMLLSNGVDLHSFQPTVDDLLSISSSDIFIYVGGESDSWVNDALGSAAGENLKVINLLEILGDSAKEEELVEGMQGEEEEEAGEEEGPEYDEHVWLSLKNASVLVNAIADALSSADPSNADMYKANAAAYLEKIQALDARYEKVASEASVKTLVFGDRFPFRYMTDDYGLEYFAAFSGCSAESEASFETVTFLSKKVDELGLHSVMTIEGTDHQLADAIIQNTETKDQQILTLNSMQSITSGDVESGASYLRIMDSNLSVLQYALSGKLMEQTAETFAPHNSGSGEDSKAASQESSGSDVDIDLTQLSSTMVYSEVYNMMITPEDFIGKTVRMEGFFAMQHDDESGNDYYACIIQDATACCSQGIEFVPPADMKYPDDFPELDSIITVSGVFDMYEEGEYTYCTLRDSVIES